MISLKHYDLHCIYCDTFNLQKQNFHGTMFVRHNWLNSFKTEPQLQMNWSNELQSEGFPRLNTWAAYFGVHIRRKHSSRSYYLSWLDHKNVVGGSCKAFFRWVCSRLEHWTLRLNFSFWNWQRDVFISTSKKSSPRNAQGQPLAMA